MNMGKKLLRFIAFLLLLSTLAGCSTEKLEGDESISESLSESLSESNTNKENEKKTDTEDEKVTTPESPRKTPIMGWASWNAYHPRISEEIILSQAEKLVEYGLDDLGYVYVNVDDGWQNGRGKDGYVVTHAKRFPSGMKALSTKIHSMGLKAGIYSDAGANTCAALYSGEGQNTKVGLYGYEKKDLERYLIDWDYDFIKVDWCGGSELKLSQKTAYTKIGNIVKDIEKKTGKDKIYNVCSWAFPGEWVVNVADSWRTGADITNTYESVIYQVNKIRDLAKYNGPGHINDLDMLQIGNGMSYEEDKTHFAMWCMMSTPLMLGMDLNCISEETLSIISNKELIAINQDVACIQAIPVKSYGGVEVWAKDLGKANSGKKAFAFLNDTDSEKTVTVIFSEVGLDGVEVVRDAWTHEDIAVDGKITVTIPSHGTLVYTAEGENVDIQGSEGSSKPSTEPMISDYNVGPMTAKNLIKNGATLIDVRTAEEFAKGHINGAKNIYYVEIEQRIASIAPNKSTPIVLYCSMAKRSTQALQMLLDMGYTNVYNLGSMDNYYSKPTLTFSTETCKVVTAGQAVKVNFTASSYDSPKVYVSAGKNSTFTNAVPIEEFKIPASSCYYITLKAYLVQDGVCYAQASSEFIYWSKDTVDVFAGDIRSKWKKATNGWGTLQIDKTIDKNTFSLSGNKFSKGIGAHAESDIIMDIPEGAKKFVAVVGMDDEVIAQMTANKVKEPNFYGMIFHVYIDGKHVDQSSLLGITKHYVFDIDIPEGAKQIRLYTDHVEYTGKDYDHADWAVAGFVNNPVKN